MTPSPSESAVPTQDAVEPLVDRLVTAMADGMDLVAGAIGDRLG